MPRENINPNAAVRLLEDYNDFSGGLNSETSNEKLRDNEFPIFENIDMNGRGSARRRYGRNLSLTSHPTGTSQGAFFYYRLGQTNPDVFLAVNGNLYLMYATPVAVSNETPTTSGSNYQLAHPWVSSSGLSVTVSGTKQTHVENPTLVPNVQVVSGSTSANIPVGNYRVGYTLTSGLGETELSPTVQISAAPGQQVQFDTMTLPGDATGINYYITTDLAMTEFQLAGSGTGEVFYISSLPIPTYDPITPWQISETSHTPPTANTATAYTIDYATGLISPVSAFAATPSVDYSYELSQMSITNLSGGFQTTRKIGAVQYGATLYIATGTQLCQYDGTTVSTVTPYEPSPMEAMWIGTNGLASNPDSYISNGTQSSGISIAGVQPEYNSHTTSTMVVNQPVTFSAFVNKASTITAVNYQFSYRQSVDPSTGQAPNSWTTGQAYSSSSTWTFTPTVAAPYDIMVTAEDANNTSDVSTPYYITSFPCSVTPPQAPKSTSGIQTCTEIAVYWDRLVLANDTDNPTQMYISDLDNMSYFPVDNTIDWDTGKREPIVKMVQFRDALFVFQKTSTQGLKGQSPSTYQKVLIHPQFGAYAGDSVQVINDMIFFLSAEGIMAFQPNMFMTYYDVVRLDYPIRTEILNNLDENASSAFYDNQYWLCIPSQSIIYRYYFDYKAWVKDVSPVLNFNRMLHYGDLLYNVTDDSNMYLVDKTVYTDGNTVYTMKVASKFYDFDEVFVQKKLKRMYLLAQNYLDHNVDFNITVTADSEIVLQPEQGQVVIDSTGAVNWITTTSPNATFYSGTEIGSWIVGSSLMGTPEISVQDASIEVSGKVRRVRIQFEHTEANLCEVYGFAFQFRLRRLK